MFRKATNNLMNQLLIPERFNIRMMKLFRGRKEPVIHLSFFLTALVICVLFPLIAVFAQKLNSSNKQTVSVKTAAPDVEFQAQPIYDNVGRGESITVFLFISNKSDTALSKFKLNIPDKTCEVTTLPSFPPTLLPFESINAEVILKMSNDVPFEQHKIPFMLQYAWDLGKGKEAVSAKSTTVTIKVIRRFEEEAKGFPGGTAAFLYLLLPIIPAILSYQFFENLRAGKGLQAPAFKTEHVVPAFFAAVVLSFLMILAFNQDKGLNYSDPRVFIGMLLASLAAGILVPGLRWLYGGFQMWRWGFNNKDSLDSYLEKALLAPASPREFQWCKGTVNTEIWEGVLLKQPDGKFVLGARLQVIPAGASQANRERHSTELKGVLEANNRQQLIKMVESGKLRLEVLEKIKRGNETLLSPVVVDEVSDFKESESNVKTLVELIN